MSELAGSIIFSVGSRNYTWEDILAAARFWSDWSALEAQARQGLACQKKAQAEELSMDTEIETAGTKFRYARNLISAEEMEAWLEERGLLFDEWIASMERAVLSKHYGGKINEILNRCTVNDQEVHAVIRTDGLCSGILDRVCHKLAGRAALFTSEKSEPAAEILNHLQQLESNFRQIEQERITSEEIAENVRNHALDWIRFDLECATFTDEQVAREAALCVRIDGLELKEIAIQTNAIFESTQLYLYEASEEWKSAFLGAKSGELVGPFRSGTQFLLFFVRNKTIPSPSDPDIREHSKQDLLKGLVNQEINNRVQWHKLRPGS